MGRYNHYLSLDATIMLPAQWIFFCMILSPFDKHDKTQFLAKFKKIL